MGKSKLALLGGDKLAGDIPPEIFKWPAVNKAMEKAVLDVLRSGNMSGTDITREFEQKFADWHGMKFGLAHSTGTAAIHGAMYGLRLGPGDEIIVPSITYWASAVPALSLGAAVVFADIDPETLCVDPADIEKRITPRTKAIEAVHYMGMPADMDAIMKLADKHRLKVIEDVSHAHGSLYRGRMVGTFGDASAFSLMSGKSFAVGEGGIMLCNDRSVYERGAILGHYGRHGEITDPELTAGAGIPWGGYKYRMHQMSSAVGLEQLKKFPGEMEEIDRAMNYFWDCLEGVPGIKAHRPEKSSGSTKGAWYISAALYRSEELGGLSVQRFAEAVTAEGAFCSPGCNKALHKHPVFSSIDIYGHGRATQGLFIPDEDLRQDKVSLPVSEKIYGGVFMAPWFKRFNRQVIDRHAEAYRKVSDNYRDLLPGDKKIADEQQGRWALTSRKS